MQNKHKYPCNSQYTETIIILIIISRNLLDFFYVLICTKSSKTSAHSIFITHFQFYTQKITHFKYSTVCLMIGRF